MSSFLTHIKINKIFHLENIDILIDEKEKKHLIITGKNGSGKSSTLNALADFFNNLIYQINYPDQLSKSSERFKNSLINLMSLMANNEINKDELHKTHENEITKKLIPSLSNIEEFKTKIISGEFLLTYYSAQHKLDVIIPNNPEKPNLDIELDIKKSKNSEFIKFLIDLKIQEALASNENALEDAAKIKKWFDDFTILLNDIFEGDHLTLEFNYKNYSFIINQDGRKFGFNQLSDGYSSIIDIISDLIMKMQTPNSLTRAFDKEGIVLIDEIETHLHLELQRLILPMLTRIFPKIQFIVTTHSPFVLNSIDNAIAYDLEKRERLNDLTDYSYEALAEGYFKVQTESVFLQTKLNRFKKLATKINKDKAEALEYLKLDEEFSNLNESLAPQYIKREYLKTKLTVK